MKLIALGDNCIDYYRNTGEAFPGGNAVNVAVHAAQQGAAAEYLGALADDRFAGILQTAMAENGVNYSNCPILPGTTTKQCVYDVVDGERTFVEVVTGDTWTGAIQLNSGQMNLLAQADVIVSSCNAKLPEQLAAVEALPPVFAFDFGEKEKYRTPEYYDMVCHGIDLAMFSCAPMNEAEFVEFCRPLHERGVVHVLATMGSQGQMLSNTQQIIQKSIQKVDACDTMGAGDSFLAAFLCALTGLGWKKHRPMCAEALERAMEKGQQVSAENCMRRGGFGTSVKLSPQR